MMNNFKTTDKIWILRFYNNDNIGCGLPCQHCVDYLFKYGITDVIYSINKENYIYMPINKNTMSYITTGYKIMESDKFLYDDYVIKKRIR